MSRMICIDLSVLIHKSIFSKQAMLKMKSEGKIPKDRWIPPVDYSYLKNILSILKRIVVKKRDKILLVQDSYNSWRKNFLKEYKAQRKELRDKAIFINWKEEYSRINKINKQIEESTDWNFIKLQNCIKFKDNNEEFGCEADDIFAYCSKYFSKDHEIIICSIDADLHQLTYLPNVKFFNINKKHSGERGFYEIIEKPLEVLSKKIKSGDKGDNISKTVDLNIKKLIINLLDLPDFVEKPIREFFKTYELKKSICYSKLPYPNSLGSKEEFNKIYLPDKECSIKRSLEVFKYKSEKKLKKSRENYQKKKEILKQKQEKALR